MTRPKRSKSVPKIDLEAYLIDVLHLRPKNVMIPGKTYTRRGAFVRKRAVSTPKKRPTKEEDGAEAEAEDQAEKELPQPLKAAIVAAKRAVLNKSATTSPVGVHDSASIQEKVRAWQSQGGGVLKASDIVVEHEDSEIEGEGSEQASRSASPIKDRWGARQETTARKQGNDSRTQSPKKESPGGGGKSGNSAKQMPKGADDGRWKRTQATQKDTEKSQTRNKNHLEDDGIRVVPIKDEQIQQDRTDKGKKTFLDDGIRVYATPPASRRNSAQNLDPPDMRTEGSIEETPPSPETSENVSTHNEDVEDDIVEVEQKEAQTVKKKKEPKRTARGIFGAVFQESKKMFTRTETVYVSPPENPVIDNWLGTIPDLPDDPFINDEEPTAELDHPKMQVRRRRKSKSTPISGPDPNGIWDTVSATSTMPESAEDLYKRQRRRRHSKAGLANVISAKEELVQVQDNQAHDEEEMNSPNPSNKPHTRRETSPGAEEPSGNKPKRNILGIAALQALFSSSKEEKSPKSSSAIPPEESKGPESPPILADALPRRAFPSVGGHRLSTIASVDTLPTITKEATPSEISAGSDFTARAGKNDDEVPAASNEIPRSGRRRRRKTRLARHADLISVLSAPRNGEKSIKSARSVATHRSRLGTATTADLMKEIIEDEVKYMRELRTLVDGVIPVLLCSVLSKAASTKIADLFSPIDKASPLNDTIYSMGVALEGLKRWHTRLEPSKAGLLSTTIFLTWAQGVYRTYKDYIKSWRIGFQDVVVNLAPASYVGGQDTVLEKGLPRNDEGDITDAHGDRVDVAFLLKRPLIRLKYLTKTLKGIQLIQHSILAEKLATDYQGLIEQARQRVNEEKARLEDEAAARVDASRACAVFDLCLVSDATVDRDRRVRARDSFDLFLLHTNGQRLEACVEIFLREDGPASGDGGDLLVCQSDGGEKWLLFSPISRSQVSARNGDSEGEIVVMIRGTHTDGREWHELVSLTTEDERVASEWIQMLGLVPIPPQLTRQQSLVSWRNVKKSRSTISESTFTDSIASSGSYLSRGRIPSSSGMQAPIGEQVLDSSKPSVTQSSRLRNGGMRTSSDPSILSGRSRLNPQAAYTSAMEEEVNRRARSSNKDSAASMDHVRTPRNLDEAIRLAGNMIPPIQRHDVTRTTRDVKSFGSPLRSASKDLSMPYTEQSLTPIFRSRQDPLTPQDTTGPKQRNRLTKTRPESAVNNDMPPPPPPHRILTPIKISSPSTIPEFDPATIKVKPFSSSPLKNQYEPSSASDDDSETSSGEADGDAFGNESSSSDEEDDFEMDDLPGPIPPPFIQVQPPSSQPSLPSKTLGPSSSASQAPYKTVPAQPNKALRVAATISYWSDANYWIPLQPDICSIVVTPGLVEIYRMSSAHSYSPNATQAELEMPSPASPPLLVLHLTPMVLLQQGTALDVTLRSPPQGGIMKDTFSGVNFLFRSRSPEEAENLYGMFHNSRMNNPTYIALQQARAVAERPAFDSTFGRGKEQTSSSWFGFGRQKSYRASSEPTPRAKSDPSIGTQSTSFSAKLFGNGRFNIAKSSVMSRQSPNGSIYTSSDNSAGSGGINGLSNGLPAGASAPLGLSNTKIRLYSREGTKWLDLGSATLTIMRPVNSMTSDADLNTPPEVGFAHGVGSNGVITPTQKRSADDKRIVVVSSKKEKPLLDVTLGDSCFERTARTGIALSLWEIFEGGTVADRGGVTNGRYRYFMMQFQNEAACAFTFSIVGRHRY